MALLLASLVDVTLVLAVVLVATAVLRRRSAAWRHAILATGMVCAVLMPAFELLLPPLPVIPSGQQIVAGSAPTLSSEVVTIGAVTEEPGGMSWNDVRWTTVLAGVWMLGSLVTFGGLLTGLVRLARLKARCTPVAGRWRELTDELSLKCGVGRHVRLMQSADRSILVACGVLNPVIILPAGAALWTEERLRIVVRHELAHISRHDAALQLVGEALRVLQPINPLVWMACRLLRQESEQACDDAVLGGGVTAADYASHLLDVAKYLTGRPTTWVSAAAIAHPSTLERRVVAMLETHKHRQPVTRRGWSMAVLAALAVALPLAAAGVEPPALIVSAPAPSPEVVTTPSAKLTVMPSAPKPTAKRAARRQTAAFEGRVVDQTGGVMPGVTVTLTDLTSNAQVVSHTNASGRFAFRNVTPAQHRLMASLAGFKTLSTVVTLSAGATLDRTITLSIGSLSETINVQCSASTLFESLVQFAFPSLSAQEPSMPIRVGGQVRVPKKIKDVRPTCPAGIAAGEATVRLSAQIGVDGLVFDAAPIPVEAGAAAPAELIEAGLDAVRQWKFTPTLLNGQPVDVTMTVTIRFTKS